MDLPTVSKVPLRIVKQRSGDMCEILVTSVEEVSIDRDGPSEKSIPEEPIFVPVPQELTRVKTGDLIVHNDGHACVCSSESDYSLLMKCNKHPGSKPHTHAEENEEELREEEGEQEDLTRLVTADSLNDVLDVLDLKTRDCLYGLASPARMEYAGMERATPITNIYTQANGERLMMPPMSPNFVLNNIDARNPPSRSPSMDVPPPQAEAKVDMPMPRGLSRSICPTTGTHTIQWSVEARKLKSSDRQIVSPAFELAGKPIPFKIMLFPASSTEFSGGSSFRNAGGKGFIQLKCDGTSADMAEFPLEVNFFIHSPTRCRGPVRNDFFQKPMCGLPQNVSSWNLKEAVKGTFFIIGVTVREYEPDVNTA